MLSHSLGFVIRLTTDLSLTNLIEMDFVSKIHVLMDISSVATKEHALEKQLESIANEWEHMEMDLTSHR